MPHLRFRGFDHTSPDERIVASITPLAALIGCPPDWITAELVVTRFVTPVAPMIEVLWFERGSDIRDRVAHALATTFAPEAPAVVFVPLAKENYYEDGKNFA